MGKEYFSPKKNPIFFKYDEEGEICSLGSECVFCDVYHNKKERILNENEVCFLI